MPKRVILRNTCDRLGTQFLSVLMTDFGDVVVEGQDVGDGVEDCFGAGVREYEWSWTVRKADVRRLAKALKVPSGFLGPLKGWFSNKPAKTVLDELETQFSGERSAGLHRFLETHRIPFESWSRLGD